MYESHVPGTVHLQLPNGEGRRRDALSSEPSPNRHFLPYGGRYKEREKEQRYGRCDYDDAFVVFRLFDGSILNQPEAELNMGSKQSYPDKRLTEKKAETRQTSPIELLAIDQTEGGKSYRMLILPTTQCRRA